MAEKKEEKEVKCVLVKTHFNLLELTRFITLNITVGNESLCTLY